MGLMMCDGKFVSRGEVALVSTPSGTETTTPPADSGATTPPSTPSTGDGEDIGWSDDYL